MDWQSLRRQRLAKAASSHEQSPPQGRLESLSLRLTELWRRFAAGSLVEKSVVVGGILLVVITVPVAIAVLASSGGGSAAGVAATSTPADIYVIDGAPTLDRPATPTLEPLPTPTARPTGEPTDSASGNRADCDEIAGTAYQSDVERLWYIENCLGGEDDDPTITNPPGSGSQPPTQPPTSAPPPTSGPAPSPTPSGPSNSTIIGYAVDWLAQDSPGYQVVSGSCTVSVVTSSQWLVSCSTRPPGCTGSACLVTASVCVAAPTYTVWRC